MKKSVFEILVVIAARLFGSTGCTKCGNLFAQDPKSSTYIEELLIRAFGEELWRLVQRGSYHCPIVVKFGSVNWVLSGFSHLQVVVGLELDDIVPESPNYTSA